MSKSHHYADLFPKLAGKNFKELVDDIAKFGLRSPITRDADGLILDGRHREAACLLAKVTPRYDEFIGSDSEKLNFVVSQNLHRRQLSISQKASIAAELLPIHAALAKAQQKAAGGNRKGRQKSLPENLPEADKGEARDRAGAAMGVSGRSVAMAAKVHAEAIPEIVAAVSAGELAVSAASLVASLPQDRQRTIMESGGVSAVRAEAGVVRRSRGRIVRHDTPESSKNPPHSPSLPVVPPATASDATSTKETITALVKLAKGAPHSYRTEVIQSLLDSLPEDKVLWVRRRCDDVLADRRRHTETASG